MSETKRCNGSAGHEPGAALAAEAFTRDVYRRDGRSRLCRACEAARKTVYRMANAGKLSADRAASRTANAARSADEVTAARATLRPDGLKVCRKCRQSQSLAAFSTQARNADGLRDECRMCANAHVLRAAAMAHWDSIGLDGSRCIYNGPECVGIFEAVDHVIPVALGGTDAPHNLRPACTPCNSSKNATPVVEWIARVHPGLAADVRGEISSCGVGHTEWPKGCFRRSACTAWSLF